MKRLLSIFLALLLIGSAGAITKTLPRWGPAQGFQAKEIQVDTLTAETITASTNVTNGVFGDDITLDTGFDFACNAGDSKFDMSLGTGMFNSTTGEHYFNGNATWASGKTVTVPGGFVGPLTGAVTGAVTGDVTGNVTAAGTVQAEQITSTDDVNITDTLYVADIIQSNDAAFTNVDITTSLDVNAAATMQDLTLDSDKNLTLQGTGSLTTGTGAVTIAGDATVASSKALAVTTADKLTVGGVIVPTAIPIASFPYTASSVDQGVFTASGAWTLTAVKMTPRVLSTSESAVTVMVKICDSGEAPASGDNMLSGTLDLKGTADTPQSGTVSSGSIANGKIVALDFTGDLTAAVGVVTLYGTRA